MSEAGDLRRWQALATIIRESQKMRDLAAANGDDFLAYLLENLLHEARSTLLAAGKELPHCCCCGLVIPQPAPLAERPVHPINGRQPRLLQLASINRQRKMISADGHEIAQLKARLRGA